MTSQQVVALLTDVCHTKAYTEVLGEIVRGDDDAGLDQHLAYRDIQRGNQVSDGLQTINGIGDQQHIGALVDRDFTPFGE